MTFWGYLQLEMWARHLIFVMSWLTVLGLSCCSFVSVMRVERISPNGSKFLRVGHYKLLGEVEGDTGYYLVDDSVSGRGRSPSLDTESEIRFNPYHPETEPNNDFIILNTIMSLQIKQKHSIDNSV